MSSSSQSDFEQEAGIAPGQARYAAMFGIPFVAAGIFLLAVFVYAPRAESKAGPVGTKPAVTAKK